MKKQFYIEELDKVRKELEKARSNIRLYKIMVIFSIIYLWIDILFQ